MASFLPLLLEGEGRSTTPETIAPQVCSRPPPPGINVDTTVPLSISTPTSVVADIIPMLIESSIKTFTNTNTRSTKYPVIINTSHYEGKLLGNRVLIAGQVPSRYLEHSIHAWIWTWVILGVKSVKASLGKIGVKKITYPCN